MEIFAFKEFYKSAKQAFKAKGIDVTKREIARYLATTSLLGELANPVTEKDLVKTSQNICEKIDNYILNKYGKSEEEVVDYGSFGKLSKGSKIWAPQKGLYIVMEASSTIHPISIQVYSDETMDEKTLMRHRNNLAIYIESVYSIEEGLLDFEPRTNFKFDLRALEKDKLTQPEELTALLE